MTTSEREELQSIADRLRLLLERVNFEGSIELYQELESIAEDFMKLLS